MRIKRKVKTHTFNGRKYKIVTEMRDGDCDTYAMNERFLCVYADMNTRNGLVTLIHESLHAENWAETEAVVDRVSKEIGTLLWRLGYRSKGE